MSAGVPPVEIGTRPRLSRGLVGRLRLSSWLPGLISVVSVLALLEAAARLGALPSSDFPRVTRDFSVLFEQLGQSSFWTAVGDTLQGWAIGLAICTVAGVLLGTLIGLSRGFYRATWVLIEFLRPVPPVAIIPLALLLYGTDLRSSLLLVLFGSLWPILIQTTYGMRSLDPVAIDTARSFSVGRLRRFRSVALPSALPYITTGVRIASAIAFVLAVTAEIVGGAPGLGNAINVARQSDAVPLTYALLIAAGLIGLGLNGALVLVERRLLYWHPSQRKRRGEA